MPPGQFPLLQESSNVFPGRRSFRPVEVDLFLPKVVDLGVLFLVEPGEELAGFRDLLLRGPLVPSVRLERLEAQVSVCIRRATAPRIRGGLSAERANHPLTT